MALFNKYKKDLEEDEKKAFMNQKMDEIKRCANVVGIISKMFDFKIAVAKIEKIVFLMVHEWKQCLNKGFILRAFFWSGFDSIKENTSDIGQIL